MIRFTKFIDNQLTSTDRCDEDLIRDCFQFCTPAVKKRVKKFIETSWHRQVTIVIKNEKVVLRKL